MLFQYFQKCKKSLNRIFVLKNLNIRQTPFKYLLKQTFRNFFAVLSQKLYFKE